MTLCETAKANQLDVFKYLKCLFEKLPQIPEFELNENKLARKQEITARIS
jgi:hypothetical protein